jgi:DNA-binding beta-propeller fold protein YncE
MNRNMVAAGLLALVLQGTAAAQEHTVIALSHSDFTIYEMDPVKGVVAQYKAEGQPHEAAVSPDGRTVYVTIPSGAPNARNGHVVVLDATQGLRLIKKIEHEYFVRSTPRVERGGMNALPHGIL